MERGLFIAFLLMSHSALVAEERLDLKGTSIIGSNELPQVLIIVPWKKTGMGKTRMTAEMSLAEDMLQPIDRTVFRRETNHFQTLKRAKNN
jgi:hypothetical protein